jgi:hypothetical protein
MPSVATIIDGIKLDQGAMAIDQRSRRANAGELCSSMIGPYFNGMKT